MHQIVVPDKVGCNEFVELPVAHVTALCTPFYVVDYIGRLNASLQYGRAGEGLGDAGGPFGGAGLVDAGIRHAETKGRLVKRAPRHVEL